MHSVGCHKKRNKNINGKKRMNVSIVSIKQFLNKSNIVIYCFLVSSFLSIRDSDSKMLWGCEQSKRAIYFC
jgi:hypothetical protein